MKPKFSTRPQNFGQIIVRFVGVAAVGTLTAQAGNTWTGTTNQDWNTASNWGGALPSTSAITINTATGNTPIISTTVARTGGDTFIGNAASGKLDINNGGSLSTSTKWLFVGQGTNGNGILNVNSGGTLTSDNDIRLAINNSSVTSGVGQLNVNGGTVTVARVVSTDVATSTISVSNGGKLTTTSALNSNGSSNLYRLTTSSFTSGSLVSGASDIRYAAGASSISGGSVTAGAQLFVGGSGVTSALSIDSGTLSNGSWLIVGGDNNSNGTINLSGTGTVNATTGAGSTAFTTIGANNNAVGVVNQTGGTWNQGGTGIVLGEGGTGSGTYNLSGGVLNTAKIWKGTGSSGIFNFNGGTLQAKATNNTDFLTGLTRANVRDGGAKINTNGSDVTVGQALVHSNIGGDSATDGGLIKSGSGTLTLTSASNSYTGATSVSAGTLQVNAGLGSTSGVAVSASATFTGQGTINGTTTLSGSTLSNNSTTTALTLGALTLNAGSNTMNLSLAGSTAKIAVTNALTTGGYGSTLNVSNSAWATGYNNLISYGSFSGSLSDFTLGSVTGTLGARQTLGSLALSGNNIALNIIGDTPTWTGVQSSQWTTAAVGGSQNWKLATAGTGTDFLASDTVLFDDNATGSTTVQIDAANVSPVSATFNNSSKNYTVASSGGFGIASGSVAKSGTGTVTFATANTYTGSTTVNAGTLQVGDGNTGSIASGSAVTVGASGTLGVNLASAGDFANAIANSGVVNANSNNANTISGLVSGTGSVTKSGSGALTLSGANTYSGGTSINGGSLQVNVSGSPSAAVTGGFSLATDTSLVLNSTANNYNYASTVALNGSGTTLSKVGSTQTNFTGTITGNGNALNVNTSASRLYINGNTTSGVSQFNVTGGAMGFDLVAGNNQGGGGAVNVSSGASLYIANATNALANNITLNGGSGQGSVGALYQEGNAAPTISGSLTLASGNSSIGGSNAGANVSVTGAVTGSGALTKIGANTYSLSNASNTYSGGTTIAAGILAANSSAALGSGAVSISNVAGAQLQLGSGVNVSNALTINGGGAVGQGVLYVPTSNANATYSGDISITGTQISGGHFASNGGALTLTGAITSSVPVTVRAGTVVMSNTASSYSTLTIQAATVRLGANNAIPVGATADLGISGAATLDLGGFNQTLTGLTKNTNAATVINSGASDSTLTTTGTSSFGGVIQNGATNKTGLTVGGGALTLSGVNTYTGATNINAGTLKLASTGSISNTSGVSLGTAGTFDVSAKTGGYTVSQLTGSGNVTGALSVSTTLAIGNSPGTVNFSSDLTLLAGSTYSYQVTGSSSTVGANTADLGIVNGNLTIDTSALLDLIQLGTYTANDKFTLFAYTGTLTGTFSGLSDDTTFTAADGQWLINYNDTTAGFNGGTTTGASYITVTAVPEPAALLLGSLGVLTLLRRRRSA